MAILSRKHAREVHIRIKGIAQMQRFYSTCIDNEDMQLAREGNPRERRLILSELNACLARFGYSPVREKDIEWESSTVTPC